MTGQPHFKRTVFYFDIINLLVFWLLKLNCDCFLALGFVWGFWHVSMVQTGMLLWNCGGSHTTSEVVHGLLWVPGEMRYMNMHSGPCVKGCPGRICEHALCPWSHAQEWSGVWKSNLWAYIEFNFIWNSGFRETVASKGWWCGLELKKRQAFALPFLPNLQFELLLAITYYWMNDKRSEINKRLAIIVSWKTKFMWTLRAFSRCGEDGVTGSFWGMAARRDKKAAPGARQV